MTNQRKHIRFEPDENTFIWAKCDEGVTHSGLCLSESQGGCSGVFKTNPAFENKNKMVIKVGKLDVIPVEIRWVVILDEEVVKVGFQYLDQ